MPPFALLWLASPFVAGAIFGASPRARRFAGRNYLPMIVLGWIGIALVVAGATFLGGTLALAALALGGPLGGLSFWIRRDEGGDDWRGGHDEPDDPPPPGGDWERIVDDLERFVDAKGGSPASGPERSPTPPAPRREPAPA